MRDGIGSGGQSFLCARWYQFTGQNFPVSVIASNEACSGTARRRRVSAQHNLSEATSTPFPRSFQPYAANRITSLTL